MTDFTTFGLPPKLMQSLARMKFDTPTPIQQQAIPLALEGRDILGSAQTGTGKTGAFGLPIIAQLMDNHDAAALILTPTRELATQVMAMMQQFIPVPNIKTALLIGGESMPKQFRQIDAKPRIIVGTPGRINDHLTRNAKLLSKVAILVLDETDRMLDMGFASQIDKIVEHIPEKRQTMLFSATLPAAIVKLSSKYLNNPERIKVGSTVVAATNIEQKVLRMADEEKADTLFKLLADVKGSTIIFVKTKYGTERLAKRLTQNGFSADAIHGDLRQTRRDRVIREFRDKKFPILVATDVAARGLDVPHIETVINYDLPQCPEDFIHRIGRTARAGASGQAVSFVTPSEGAKWRAIHQLMNPGEPLPPQERTASKGGFKSKGRGAPKPRRFGGSRPTESRFASSPKEAHDVDAPFKASGRGAGSKFHEDRKPSEKKSSDRDRPERSFSGKSYPSKDRSERTFADKARPHKERSERTYASKDASDTDRARKPFAGKDAPHKERGERTYARKDASDTDRARKPFGGKDAPRRDHSERSFSGKPYAGKSSSEKSSAPRGKAPFNRSRKPAR